METERNTHDLSDAEIGILKHVAIGTEGGEARTWHLARAAGEDLPDADAIVRLLVERSLLVARGDVVSIAGDGLTAFVASSIDAQEHRSLHLKWAETATCHPGPVTVATVKAEHLVRAGDNDGAIAQLRAAAGMHENAGRPEEAMLLLDRAVDLAGEPSVELLEQRAITALKAHDPRARALWSTIGQLHSRSGQRELEARALCQQHFADRRSRVSLEVAGGLGDEVGWALYARALGHVLDDDYAQAIPLDRRALEIARSNDDSLLESAVLDHLGLSYLELQQGAEAIEMLRAARDVALDVDDPNAVIRSSANLAVNLAQDLRLSEALDALRIAAGYVTSARLGYEGSVIDILLAYVLAGMGRLADARRVANTAFDRLPKEPGDHSAWAVAFDHALIMLQCGDLDAAARSVERAEQEAAVLSFRSFRFETRFARSQLDAVGGRFDCALQLAREPEINEPHSLAMLALWLTRTSALHDNDDLLDAGRSLRGSIRGEWPRITSYSVAEIDAITAALEGGGVQPVLERARRWRHHECHIQALEATVTAGMIAARNGATTVAIELLADAHAELVERGAVLLACAASDRLDELVSQGATGRSSLATIEVFSALRGPAMNALRQVAAPGRCDRDAVLVAPDAPAAAMYILRTGSVKVFRHEVDDRELIVAMIDAGDVCGAGIEPPAGDAGGLTLQALEPCTYWSIPAERLDQLVHDFPELGMALLAVAQQRLSRANELAGSLAFHSIDERLARLLLDLDGRYGRPTLEGSRLIDRTISHDAIASMIGAARITVTLGLKRLKERGIIANRKRKILICDPAALRAIIDRSTDEAA